MSVPQKRTEKDRVRDASRRPTPSVTPEPSALLLRAMAETDALLIQMKAHEQASEPSA
ncbi:hypothetical protein [Niveispirillum sp. KHB5.9]|uniref:hypothetical protein n=1 Tax=Niveispirillum sp. KHB5.9 TaxID=3400269 RepID=UPI003A895BDB